MPVDEAGIRKLTRKTMDKNMRKWWYKENENRIRLGKKPMKKP